MRYDEKSRDYEASWILCVLPHEAHAHQPSQPAFEDTSAHFCATGRAASFLSVEFAISLTRGWIQSWLRPWCNGSEPVPGRR